MLTKIHREDNMMSLAEFLSRKLNEDYKGEAINVYEDSFGKLSEHDELRIIKDINGLWPQDLLTEHLKNVDPKLLIKDIKRYFNSLIYVEEISIEKGNVIHCWSDKSVLRTENGDFDKLLDIYQYFVKFCNWSRHEEAWQVELVPNYPEEIDKDVVYHVTDKKNLKDILRVGFRPRYIDNDNKSSRWKEYKKNTKNPQFNKTYFFYVENEQDVEKKATDIIKSKRGSKENKVILKIDVPKYVVLYKDNTMPDDNCCFIYYKISPENITTYKEF